jgi:hypothetical protein
VQNEVDELADVPPEEFVVARDELAKSLKAEGKADAAAQVKKLRKPTVTQWVADQVRRQHADDVDALRAAVSDVAHAQELAVTQGDRDPLREATTKRRDAVDRVGRAVDDVLASNGRAAQYRDEVLHAIEAGVTDDIASGTFGLREDLELPKRRPTKKQPARDRVAERRSAEAAKATEAAEARVRRARDDLEKAESELAALRERHGRSG